MSLSCRSFGALLVLSASAACALDDPESAVSLMVDARPLQAFGMSSAASDDSILQLPAYLRLAPGGWIFTLETARPSVVGYRAGLASPTIVGRIGRGPGEMAGPMSMDVSPSGRVWIADHGNAKMVAYQGNTLWGEFLVDHAPMGVVAVGDSAVWVGGDLRRSVMVRYDTRGRRLGTAGVPPDTSRMAFRLNQGSASRGAGPCAVIWAFRFRSRVDCYREDGSTAWSAEGPVRIAPDRDTDPYRMQEKDRFAYTDVSAHGDRVYALFIGGPVGNTALRTDRAHVFAARDGRFLGTVRLPRRTNFLIRSDSLLGLLDYEPEPHILVYRVREER
jgi:hypothetical protein